MQDGRLAFLAMTIKILKLETIGNMVLKDDLGCGVCGRA